jgi:hypothetical protein
MVFMVLGTLTYLINSVLPAEIELKRQRQTEAALAMAKDALIGYALQYRDQQAAHSPPDLSAMYGFLPMPDVGTSRFHPTSQTPACNTEGCAMSFVNGSFPATTDTVIGRFPWRTLGIGPLRDGHGECLWYAVSAAHKSLGIDPAITMNWDTLGQLDFVEVSGGALVAKNASAYDRPVAIIFSPGAPRTGQDRGPISGSTDITTECGGNYVVANYLDTAQLAPVFTSTNGASGDTGSQPKPLSTKGKIPTAENPLANDIGLSLSSDTLFGAIRKNNHFRNDINTMLDRMVGCLRDQFLVPGKTFVADSISGYTAPSGKIAGRIPDDDIDNDLTANTEDTDFPATGIATASTCYDNAVSPMGYFSHYKDQLFVAKSTGGDFTVTSDGTSEDCPGVLIFAGQRDTTTLRCPTSPTPTLPQSRTTVDERKAPCNYLEEENLSSFIGSGAPFSGARTLSRISPSQTSHQDIVRCIPNTPSFSVVAPSVATSAGSPVQLASYTPTTRTLTLGSAATHSNYGAAAANLFACSWTPETRDAGSGFRSYFRFRIRQVGEGFTFAVIDGEKNDATVCGAARQHLGYSGNNGVTSYIQPPKLAVEFDTVRNGGFAEPASLSNGRNDPCYLSSCGASQNLSSNAHVGIVYWGYESSHAGTPSVTQVQEEDNVHGFAWPSNYSWPQSSSAWPPNATPTLAAASTRPAPHNPDVALPYPINGTTSSNATSTSTIILANTTGYDNMYKQAVIDVGSDTRTIVSYVDATKTATVDTPFSSLIPGSTAYKIYRQTGVAPLDRMGATSPAATAPAKREFHARVEVTRSRSAAADAKDGTTGIQVQVWIEPHTAANISAITFNAGSPPTLSVTAASHGLNTGDTVVIKDALPIGYNGEYTVTRIDADNFIATLPSGTPNPGPYISAITWADFSDATDMVTVTSANHGLNTGDSITITGAVPAEYNGTRIITRIDDNAYWFGLELSYEPGNMPPGIAAAKDLSPRATAIANTTRPMSLLYPSFKPIVTDSTTIYDTPMGACAVGEPRCPDGQSCGSDSRCYRPYFKKLRLGFTIGERVTSSTSTARGQMIEIKDQITTWLE